MLLSPYIPPTQLPPPPLPHPFPSYFIYFCVPNLSESLPPFHNSFTPLFKPIEMVAEYTESSALLRFRNRCKMLTVTGSLSAAETAAIHAGNSGSYRERFHPAVGFITVVHHVKSWFVHRAVSHSCRLYYSRASREIVVRTQSGFTQL